jgi:hypothetical protein
MTVKAKLASKQLKAKELAGLVEEDFLSTHELTPQALALEFGKFFRAAMVAKMVGSDQPYKEVELEGCFELALEAFEMWKKWVAGGSKTEDQTIVEEFTKKLTQ